MTLQQEQEPMKTIPEKYRTLMCEILKRELDASEQLQQLLVAERKAITDRDIPAFEALVDKKRLLLEHFARYEKERMVLLDSSGINHGPESMDDYIKRCPADKRLPDLWKKLFSLAAECRDHNRQNHQLVEVFSTHTSKALHILRGEVTDQNVYGPDGDTNDPHENRSLGIV
jgi:flagellar biosynthesis/type III secretory pathway chaperone